MTLPDEVLAAIAPPWRPRCEICASPRPIVDDGFLVCGDCVRRIGRIAGNPLAASELELLMLVESHRDVVALRGSGADIFWHWRAG